MRPEKSRIRILTAIGASLVGLLLLSFFCMQALQRQGIQRDVEASTDGFQRLLQTELDEEAELYQAVLDSIEKQPSFQKAWLAHDREELFRQAAPLFAELRSQYKVTHLYFIGLDKVCFLRVHQEERHGDPLDRVTLDEAVREGKTVQGIELGPLGTFTLRVVRPWKIDGKLAGYIEIGEGIDHIVPEIKRILDADFVFYINKNRLNRSDWEKGMEMLGRKADWDQFPDHVVVGSTIRTVPLSLKKEMARHEASGHEEYQFEMVANHREYMCGFVSLIDAGSREVGEVIVMQDVTILRASARRFLWIVIGVCVLVGLMLFGFLYLYIGHIQKVLVKNDEILRGEIEQNKRAKEALARQTALLNETQQLTHVGGWQWNVEQQTMMWTDELYRIHGFSRDEFEPGSAKHIARGLACYDPEYRPIIKAASEQCVADGTPYDLEFPFTAEDGVQKWIRATGQAVLENDRLGKDRLGKDRIVRVFGNVLDITERRQSEAVLRLKNQVFDKSIAANSMADTNGNMTEVNDAFLKLWGYPDREGVIGRPICDFLNNAKEVEAIVTALDAVGVWEGEFLAKRQDGSTFIGYSLGTVLRDSNGESLGYQSSVNDITERKQAEQKLRESEKNQENLIQNLYSGVIVHGPDTEIILANETASELLGLTIDPMKGKKVSDPALCFIHEDETPFQLEEYPIARVFATKSPIQGMVVGVVRPHEKDPVWIMTNAFPEFASDGQIAQVVVTFTDITERKQSEEQLEAVAKFPAENPYPVLRIDAVGTLLHANPAGKTLLESHDELSGDQVHDRWKEGVSEALATGTNLPREFQYEDAIYAIHFTPIMDEGYVNAYGMDISERKKAEEENAKLQGQLNQAQKMESVGRLAGGVAHDFNNMLGVILGHAEMAMDRLEETDPNFNDLMEISKAATRSADITRQLLAFARKQTVAPKTLDLNQALEETHKMLQRLIGEHLDLTWRPGADLWAVKIDPSQLDQMLVNLCVNARDAIADVGHIFIETENATFDEAYCVQHPGFIPGEYVRLTVSDDGCGMDPKTQESIFEPFFTTKEVGKGTGLGLATVFGAVKQNSGFINVYSELGHGTRFSIYLPRYTGKPKQVSENEVSAEATTVGKETILLVEDELAILQITTRMLKKQGYTVLAASSPGEGIRMFESYPGHIDLLMTDVVMPEMNGRDLAKHIVSLCPNISRLFMSGYTADVIAQQGMLDPGVCFIQKPFSIKDLGLKIREALDPD